MVVSRTDTHYTHKGCITVWYLETNINYTSSAQEQTYSEARYFFQNIVQILHFCARNKLKINACVVKCMCHKVQVLERKAKEGQPPSNESEE